MWTLSRFRIAGAVLLLAPGSLALLLTSPAHADSLKFDCKDTQASRSGTMSLAYEGGASGVLRVKGVFGEMTLPATKVERDKAVGVRAFGPATAAMPDQRALEACIAARTKPGEENDADLHALNVLACRDKVPEGTPIPIKVKVEISVEEPPLAFVFMSRTYLEKSSAPGGVLAIETVPPPACTLSGTK